MYQIPKLHKYKNIFHAFSEKSDGNMANSINGKIIGFEKVLENRKRFLKGIGVDINKTICMWVTHGDEIVEADEKLAGESVLNYRKAVKVDGLITNKKGVYLFLLIADCLPIVIYDPKKEVIALVHAGWKGVDLEISKKAVLKLTDKYNSNAKDLIVGIGPCAYKESFIKVNPSQKDDLRWQGFIKKISKNTYSIDLIGFTKKQLFSVGIKKENIFESGVNTVKDKRFFSHVRDAKNHISRQGRFACIVGLK